MFNWAELLADKGLKTKFVIFFREREQVLKMTNDTKQPLIKIHIVRFFLVRNLVHFFVLLFIYFNARIKYRKVIFQTRTPSVSPTLALLKFLPGLKIITDIRGYEPEKNNPSSLSSRLKLFSFNSMLWLSVKIPDRIFCVSNPLVQLISERFKLNGKDIFSVFGGVADEKYFFFDNDLRKKFRKEYAVEDKILLLYSGMLDKPWQIPEKYFEFFASVLQKQSNIILVLLTPNTEIALKLRDLHNIPKESMIIKESGFSGLVNYYNMADFGLLFRSDDLVNRVASPTKFSEYALCGLPVIISDHIGDFSDHVTKSGFGYVIKDTESVVKEVDNILRFISQVATDRSNIAAENKKTYSKQSQVERLLTVYQSI